MLAVGFPTGRDSATFQDSGTGKTFLYRDKGTTGQKFLHCPGTKGQLDKLKILPRDGTGQCNFSGQRDRQNFFVPGQRDNRTEVPSLSRDKGTTGQAQNLATGRDGPGQPKFGMGQGGIAKIRDRTRDKTGQSRKGHSKKKLCSKTENDVL